MYDPISDEKGINSANGKGSESLLSKQSIGKILLAGTGFMADSFDLFVVNLVTVLMKTNYPDQTDSDVTLVKGMALFGAVIGQLFFGTFADCIGRRVIFLCTLTLTILACALSSVSYPIGALNVYQTLAICRLILGIGVGGEYPLSATITSESSTASFRGRMMASVFSVQGIGTIFGSLVVVIVLSAGASDMFAWRFALAFGCVPGLLSFYFRWKMHETEAFQNHESTRVSQTETLKEAFRNPELVKTLIGTAFSWFLLDITFYGNSLFNADINSAMGYGKSGMDKAKASLLIACMGYPGYIVSILCIDKVGRKNIQLIGFAMLAILFGIMAAAYKQLKELEVLFFIIYGATFFFSNFGPNATTYIIPGEVFPAKVRATCHGISAASGKLGAAITTYVFVIFKKKAGLQAVFAFCACVGIVGFLTTAYFIPRYTAETIPELHRKLGGDSEEDVNRDFDPDEADDLVENAFA